MYIFFGGGGVIRRDRSSMTDFLLWLNRVSSGRQRMRPEREAELVLIYFLYSSFSSEDKYYNGTSQGGGWVNGKGGS